MISFCLIIEQSVFAQSIDLSHYFANSGKAVIQSDKFRPLHLRYLGYDNLKQDFKILLDKGDTKREDLESKSYIEENTHTLLKYFFIGLSLPNEKFWVNLRPDSPDNILDPDLEKTDIGRIFLEADLQLKKDTAGMTSPQTPEGKAYWDKLYKKAGELFGNENITIPTITRPWIVPNEIIIREAPDNAYIYKATLKVMLEEDYFKSSQPSAFSNQQSKPNYQPLTSNYNFSDPRLKELNQYSTQLIKETIIPKLTYEVNTSKRYAQLRQVYYSLILAQWFKQKYSRVTRSQSHQSAEENPYVKLIDSGSLTSNFQPLTSQNPYSKETYFQQYQKSFAEGEYNLQEPAYTPYGQSIRRYMSGGIKNFMSSSAVSVSSKKEWVNKDERYLNPNPKRTLSIGEEFWGQIEKELKNIEISGKRKYFIDTDRPIDDDVIYGEENKNSRLVRLSYNLRDKPKILDGGDMPLSQGYDLVQIEDMFFIDQEVYESLSKGLRKDLGNKAIVVPGLSQSTLGQSEHKGGRMKKFTAAAILSLLHSEISGKCVIDAGAGDGMLALVAAKLGASQLILIDNDIDTLQKAKRNLEGNGLKEGIHFWLIAGDLADKDALIGQLPEIKDNVVLVSNLGTWPLDYGQVTNLTSFEAILSIDKKYNIRISEIILGGYLAGIPELIKYSYEINEYDEYKKHWPDNDIDILTRSGFIVRPEKSRVGECISISAASSAAEGDLQNRLNAQEILNKLNSLGAFELEYGLAVGEISVQVGQFYTSLSNILTENGFDVTVAGRLAQTFAKMKNGSLEILVITGVITEEERNIFVSKDENKLRALDNQVKKEFADRLKRLYDSYKLNLNKNHQELMLKRLIPLEIIEPLSSENNTSRLHIIHIISRHPNFPIWLPKAKAKVEQIKDSVGSYKNAWRIVIAQGIEKVDAWVSLAEIKVNSIKGRVGGPANAWAKVIAQGIDKVDAWLKSVTEFASPSKSGIGGVDDSTSSPTTSNNKGGIAFNALPIQTETVASSALGAFPAAHAFKGDLNAEWVQIQAVFNAGIRPSIQRLSEYTQAASASPLAEEKIDEVREMLADMLRREEEDDNLRLSGPALKKLLSDLEGDADFENKSIEIS